MDKGKKIAIGFVGLGLLYYGFTNKSTFTATDAEKGTDNILNVLDANLALDDRQIRIVANNLKKVNNDPISDIQVRSWRGLIQLEIEGQLAEKNLLTFAKMQQIQIEFTGIFRQITKTGYRLITKYCNQNKYTITDSIYTIETNLVNISKYL